MASASSVNKAFLSMGCHGGIDRPDSALRLAKASGRTKPWRSKRGKRFCGRRSQRWCIAQHLRHCAQEPGSPGGKHRWPFERLVSLGRLFPFCFLCLGGYVLIHERLLDSGYWLKVDVLVGIHHQPLPYHCRERAAGHVASRAEIVITQPDGRSEIAGETAIPGVAVSLRGSGLAGRDDAGQGGTTCRANDWNL